MGRIKLNETALMAVALIIIAIPLLVARQNREIERKILREQNEKRAELEAFITKYNEQVGLNALALRYEESPLDRDAVHEYVHYLISMGGSGTAIAVIDRYFKEVPREEYWEDTELWIDRAVAALKTNRCMEAMVNAWHISQHTANEEARDFAGMIVGAALNQIADQGGCTE